MKLRQLTACGSSKNGLTADDLAIVKVGDEKAVVQYGMSRANVEKVLGEAENDGARGMMFYNNGVGVLYRENSAVAILMNEDSKGSFITSGGLEVNMNKNDLYKIYDEKNAIEVSGSLNFAYDSVDKKYLKEVKYDSD
ncbi:hypothetical protein [Paenibacillus riograndensis]|nr:hypothetical protein [Paenibacillus riograndensis]